MGVLSDLLANAKTFDGVAPSECASKTLVRTVKGIIAAEGDSDYPSGTEVRDEVQSIAVYTGTVSAGNFTLTFTLFGGQTFTTANIAFGANAATIQTAIHTAAALAAVPGWATGHIAVTGGNLNTSPVVLTFSGASVSGRNHGLTVITGVSLTGGNAGAVSTTTHGQSARSAWGALMALGIVTSAPPVQGVDVSSVTVASVRGNFPHKLDNDSVLRLADEAAYQDANETVRTKLRTAWGY